MDRPVLTHEQKRDNWVEQQLARTEFWERAAKFAPNQSTRHEIAAIAKAEALGGKCFICHHPWKHVTYENDAGMADYYVPDCNCYPECPNCETLLYQEQVTGYLARKGWHCPNCGWLLLDGTTKRWGPEIKEKLKKAREECTARL